ncbi:reverse transcriptase family protein [Advenella mimigardefordensis]|uniref:RNA-directed DNA polymerase n=1 Tax=Advenella mimigardefordensis (strain DSM 17166 / LMG 22922 / DPN7) TaxID=1247726 RepID=W0PEC7_ADVMD|nr:reverse transcriptase family protein [Advenella mimigardefordensis]AHG65254.1 putative RNA-directed DNA polymerase [Advenella mimigardefordensis DPN7]
MRPLYLAKPIASLQALSSALRIDVHVLKSTAANIDRHYHPHSVPKKDGSSRSIYIPSIHLKKIQKRINRNIFDKIKYPDYLFGGIKERDYVKNANAHASAETLIALDIRGFYPSITYEKTLKIFKFFFKFPEDVAALLTDLVCLRGRVPQGACTSSHIANLSLHEAEYHLVQHIRNKEFTYTRLLDDISISSKKQINEIQIQTLIGKVRKMLNEQGFKLQNKKTRITSRKNPEKLMEVTGLWLNRGQARLHRQERRLIRAELHNCEKLSKLSRTSIDYHELHNSLSGRVAKLTYLGHKEAACYRSRLREILPVYDDNEIHRTIKLVSFLEKSSVNDRKKYAYYAKFHQVGYRLNILRRTQSGLANKLAEILRTCKPPLNKEELFYHEII